MATYLLKQCFSKNLINRVLLISNKYSLRKTSDIIGSPLQDVNIPDLTIPEYVFQHFSAWPNKSAVECSVTGKNFTYEEIRKKSKNLGNGLRNCLKLKEDDVIAVLLPNVPEYPICVLGVLQAGLIVTTINPMHMSYEIKRQLQETNAKAIITVNKLWLTVQFAMKNFPKKLPVFTIKVKKNEDLPVGAIQFEEFTDTEFDTKYSSCKKLTDVALISYTSGTTNLPKGVDFTHRNIVANLCQINIPYFKTTKSTTATYQDVVMDMIPWCHIYGLTSVLFNHLYNLCKIVSLPQFLHEQYLTALVKHQPSLLYVSPSTVTFMSNDSIVKKEYLQPLRNITTVQGCLGACAENKFLEKAEKDICMLQIYGLTETALVFMTSPIFKEACNFSGTIGEILPNTLVKLNPTNCMNTKSCGELLIKGPQVMKGYHNNPEKTESVFINGWLRTNDLVYYDNNKMFYIKDRLQHMITVDGFKVCSKELEEVIASHPQVLDVAVIGISDTIHEEVPRAYVVAKPGEIIDVSELLEFVDEQLISYKNIVGGIAIVDSIPKTVFGTILKRHLKLIYECFRES